MNITLKPGKYVVAVSGGVDSVVLLDLLSHLKNVDLLVAHFDHGIRDNSKDDRLFVENLTAAYGLVFFYEEGKLGRSASEAKSRTARYKFLRKIKHRLDFDAIITAHHQDDVIETAIINLLRGTRARGLSALKSTTEIIRPLLEYSKQEIVAYGKSRKLDWREDATNQDQKYLRNYVRLNLMPRLNKEQRVKFLKIIEDSNRSMAEVSTLINNFLPSEDEINRRQFINLPHSVACELIASWLKIKSLNVNKKTVQRLAVGLKSAKNNSKLDINQNYQFIVETDKILLHKEKVI